MFKKTFLLSLVSCLMFLVSPVRADDEVRNLEVNLQAKGFSQTNWQDNLQSKDIIFAPGDKFQIRLTVRNLGNRTQTQIFVKTTLLPTVELDTNPNFVIPQILPGADYAKIITVTVKDKKYINQALTANTIRMDIKSDAGTTGGDFTTFYTNNGAKETSSDGTTKGGLPTTGTAETLILGTLIAALGGLASLKFRRLAQGY